MLIDIYIFGFCAEFVMALFGASVMIAGVRYRAWFPISQEGYKSAHDKIKPTIQMVTAKAGSDYLAAAGLSIIAFVSAGICALIWPWSMCQLIFRLFRNE